MQIVTPVSVQIAASTSVTVTTTPGNIVFVGSISSGSSSVPAMQTQIPEIPSANTAWFRGYRLSTFACMVMRNGVATVGFLISALQQMACQIVAGLSWVPNITTQPSAQSCIHNSTSASFAVVATSETTIQYLWRENSGGGYGLPLTTTGIYNVATPGTLTVTPTAYPGQSGYYYQCTLFNYANTTWLASNATLPTSDDTVLIGTHTYRFRSTGDGLSSNYDVHIAGTVAATLLNLINCINGGGAPGTDYYTGTPVNTQVVAAPAVISSTMIQIAAIAAGTYATTTPVGTTLTWASASYVAAAGLTQTTPAQLTENS